MKNENRILKSETRGEGCGGAFCLACKTCREAGFEEAGIDLPISSSQLYAAEARQYFFYFTPLQENQKK